jgi:hypothetical protein
LSQNDFGNIISSAVEESLSCFGNSVKQAIFFHLETSFQIDKEDIATNLAEFKDALERIFGHGATCIEKLITKRVYEKVGLDPDDVDQMDFFRCINKAKNRNSARATSPYEARNRNRR